MITAVDTSVLLDVLEPDPAFGQRSAATLRECVAQGSIVACDVVWAELAAWSPSPERFAQATHGLGLRFDPLGADAAALAGTLWRSYRNRGGPRTRIVTDLLIGAHAATRADRLLTRDRGFYRRYFGDLAILDPTV